MSQNLQLDPKKRDYVFSGGSPISSDRVFEKAYYALQIPQNNWLYGEAGQGSYLYTMNGIRRSASVEQTFSAYATSAIRRQLINTGSATQVQVSNALAEKSTTVNNVAVTPGNQQLSTQLGFTPV